MKERTKGLFKLHVSELAPTCSSMQLADTERRNNNCQAQLHWIQGENLEERCGELHKEVSQDSRTRIEALSGRVAANTPACTLGLG